MFKCVYLLALFLVVILQKFIARYFWCFINIYICIKTDASYSNLNNIFSIMYHLHLHLHVPSPSWPPVDFGPATKLGMEDSPFCSNFSRQTVVWIVPNYVRPRKFTQYSNNRDVQTRGKLSDQCTRLGSCVLARSLRCTSPSHDQWRRGESLDVHFHTLLIASRGPSSSYDGKSLSSSPLTSSPRWRWNLLVATNV